MILYIIDTSPSNMCRQQCVAAVSQLVLQQHLIIMFNHYDCINELFPPPLPRHHQDPTIGACSIRTGLCATRAESSRPST